MTDREAMMTREEIETWRKAVLDDGWVIEPVYPDESIDTYCRLSREGFVANVMLRTETDFGGPMHNLHIWGSDGLAIRPKSYSWKELQESLQVCSICGVIGPTVRLAFANRVCPKCRALHVDKYEYPGWCD